MRATKETNRRLQQTGETEVGNREGEHRGTVRPCPGCVPPTGSTASSTGATAPTTAATPPPTVATIPPQ